MNEPTWTATIERDRLRKQVMVGLLVVTCVGTVSGWLTSAHYRGVAEAEAASNERLEEERDDARAAAELARQESDRIIAETERQRAKDSATIAAIEGQLHDLGRTNAELRAAAEAELLEHDDWVSGEAYRAHVASLERTVAVSDSLRHVEREGRLQERRRGDALQVQVGELLALVENQDELLAGKDRQIAALERAAGSSLFELDVDAGLWAGGGLVVGYLLGSR